MQKFLAAFTSMDDIEIVVHIVDKMLATFKR